MFLGAIGGVWDAPEVRQVRRWPAPTAHHRQSAPGLDRFGHQFTSFEPIDEAYMPFLRSWVP
jgi:hypothetical protein